LTARSRRADEGCCLPRNPRCRGAHDVPDPEIVDAGDSIIEVTATAICGSDLHLYDDFMPTMEEGDVLGHEPMGEVVEVGSDVKKLKKGDRVVVPFPISCGICYFCAKGLFSLCDIYVTASRIQDMAWFKAAAGPRLGTSLFRIERGR
jgi:threonine dehydrogenase-like Zn-dependent dehydrogenase